MSKLPSRTRLKPGAEGKPSTETEWAFGEPGDLATAISALCFAANGDVENVDLDDIQVNTDAMFMCLGAAIAIGHRTGADPHSIIRALQQMVVHTILHGPKRVDVEDMKKALEVVTNEPL